MIRRPPNSTLFPYPPLSRPHPRPPPPPFALGREPLRRDVRIELPECLLRGVEPEQHARRLLGDLGPRAGVLVDRRGARDVARAQVLGERARDGVGQSAQHRTVTLWKAGSLAPCRRAPASARARRYSTTPTVIRSPGSNAGMPGG